MKKPELLAPASDWATLNAAINAGCDAVYFGLESLNMRAKAKNFTKEQLPELVEFCHSKNVDVHLTVNSIIYENELSELDNVIKAAKTAGVDLIICWDAAVIQKCKAYGMPFCISTQASVSNSNSANFYKDLGAARVVLARECTLEMIEEIKQNTDIEIEAFIHGAMCIAVSGRCFMSHYAFGKSANKGECIQPCRREYEIIDRNEDQSLIIGEDYVLSPKDLCTIEFIDRLIELGIDSFKIEGRKRSPEYIAKVVSTYRHAIDLHYQDELTDEIKKEMKKDLAEVYNRGFSNGFYFGQPGHEDYAEKYGSAATTKKTFIGKVINYFKQPSVAHILIQSNSLKVGDRIYIIGEKTGIVETVIESMLKNEMNVTEGKKGEEITFVCKQNIRPRDKVYKVIKTT